MSEFCSTLWDFCPWQVAREAVQEAFAPSLTWAAQWMRASWPEKGLKEEEQVGWAPRDSGASLVSGVGT